MNLTEPQAGSDLGALRTRAVPDGDHYRITGPEDLHHLWRARLDRPTSSISCWRGCPTRPPAAAASRSSWCRNSWSIADGSLGARNDRPLRQPRAQARHPREPDLRLALATRGGAIGYLVGEPNRGLAAMFTMMNHARLDVGLQGVAIAERAYQQARDFARAARAGPPGRRGRRRRRCRSSITPMCGACCCAMRAATEATRALAYYVAADDRPRAARRRRGRARAGAAPRRSAHPRGEGVEHRSRRSRSPRPTSRSMAAWASSRRPARRSICATPASRLIYEGTNGIQANDLVGRKLTRDDGAAVRELVADMRATVASSSAAGDVSRAAAAARRRHRRARDGERRAARIASRAMPRAALAGVGALSQARWASSPAAGSWRRAPSPRRAVSQAATGDAAFLPREDRDRALLCRALLATAPALLPAIAGGATVMGFDLELAVRRATPACR